MGRVSLKPQSLKQWGIYRQDAPEGKGGNPRDHQRSTARFKGKAGSSAEKKVEVAFGTVPVMPVGGKDQLRYYTGLDTQRTSVHVKGTGIQASDAHHTWL